MNKKAFFMGMVLDWLGWFILLLGVIFWSVMFTVTTKDIYYDIQQDTAYLNDDATFLAYLRTPVDNKIIADLIVDVYKGNDATKLKEELNKILNSVYGRSKPACWTLWYYEGDKKKDLVSVDCSEKKELFDAETLIPMPYNEQPLNIRLTVLGYS